MLLEFAKTADYWLHQANVANAANKTREALTLARKAFDLDKSFRYWHFYATMLMECGQYAMSAAICLRYCDDLDEAEYTDFLALMTENSIRGGSMAAYLHYQLLLVHNVEGEEAQEDFGDMLMGLFEHLGAEKSDKRLMFNDEARDEKQRVLYDDMFEAYSTEDYRRVLEMCEGVDSHFKYYPEMLFMKGMSAARTGDPDTGKACLWEMYKVADHDARVLYYLDEIGDGLTDEEMEKALSVLGPDGSKDNMAMAAICAASHGLNKTALFYSQEAYKLGQYDPEHIFRLAAAYVNAGDSEKGAAYIKEVLQLYDLFLPSVIADLPLTAHVDLYFDYMPRQLFDGMTQYIDRLEEQEYFAVLMQTDARFREAVRFLLSTSSYDGAKQSKLANKVVEWMTPEGIAFMRQLLVMPTLPNGVQFRLLYNMLDNVRKGNVRVSANYLIDVYKLRVPPSFDDYDEQLKRIYVYAYCEMVHANVHSELKLSRACEKLYLTLPEDYYQANIMGYALAVAAKVVDGGMVDETLTERKYDADLFMRYRAIIKDILRKA
jgi:tetratricopeptide (TPR) repeat protein